MILNGSPTSIRRERKFACACNANQAFLRESFFFGSRQLKVAEMDGRPGAPKKKRETARKRSAGAQTTKIFQKSHVQKKRNFATTDFQKNSISPSDLKVTHNSAHVTDPDPRLGVLSLNSMEIPNIGSVRFHRNTDPGSPTQIYRLAPQLVIAGSTHDSDYRFGIFAKCGIG